MYNGIINVYKEKGFTSHDVVAKLRGIFHQKKIGHTGTLDPDAEGVLPVCLGNGTKLCDMLTDKDKTYEAVMLLGVETDTQDISGNIIAEKEVAVTEEQAVAVISSFVGEYMQVPPMYSALKINGKKLYELAREGKVVERKARQVTIHSIDVTDISFPRITMKVKCSKGTYIRTLCDDIGRKLGCGGCMEKLIRTKVSCFDISESRTLAEIEQKVSDGSIDEIITGVEEMFLHLDSVSVAKEWDRLLFNGNPFGTKCITGNVNASAGVNFRVYSEDGVFIGIYVYDGNKKMFCPMKIFCLDRE